MARHRPLYTSRPSTVFWTETGILAPLILNTPAMTPCFNVGNIGTSQQELNPISFDGAG